VRLVSCGVLVESVVDKDICHYQTPASWAAAAAAAAVDSDQSRWTLSRHVVVSCHMSDGHLAATTALRGSTNEWNDVLIRRRRAADNEQLSRLVSRESVCWLTLIGRPWGARIVQNFRPLPVRNSPKIPRGGPQLYLLEWFAINLHSASPLHLMMWRHRKRKMAQALMPVKKQNPCFIASQHCVFLCSLLCLLRW